MRPLATAGAALLALSATAWWRPLHLPDEGRYVGVAREMLLSGDLLTPTLNGLPYFHKPPLFYWITAASMGLFGVGEWAARVAPLLGAVLGAVALHRFLHHWDCPRNARLALAALLTHPLWFIGSQVANMDMLVAGCITAAIVWLAEAAMLAQAGLASRPALLAGWSFVGLGVLAKGLIGIVIPALVVGLWLLRQRSPLGTWRALVWWPAPGLASAIAAPWFVAMAGRYPGFLRYFFVEQHWQRYMVGGFNNPQPWWFCAAVLLLFSAPGLEGLGRSCARPAVQADPVAGAPLVVSLMRIWVVTVVVFFSVPTSKLVGYVLPAVPAVAALMAVGLGRPTAPDARRRRRWGLGVGLAGAISLALVLGVALEAPKSSRAMGQALREQRRPSQPVWTLGVYPFDLPFYAGLEAPMRVLNRWDDPDIGRRDNWRKELADAGRFAPVRAQQLLVTRTAWPAVLCGEPLSWVIGADTPDGWPTSLSAPAERWPLAGVQEVAQGPTGLRLWKVDLAAPGTARALGCPAPGDAD